MVKSIISTVLFILLALCLLGLIASMCALMICWLSDKSAFFLKLYMFFFEKEDYKQYKEVKKLIKENQNNVKVCSSFTETDKMQGYYFIVHEKCVSLWKDSNPIFVSFHQYILDEFIKLGDYMTDILCTREADIYHRKQLEKRIKELEKEIAERKAKLAELNGQDNA